MKFNFDFDKLYDWGERLSNTTRFMQQAEEMTRTIAERLLETIKGLTPTETGALVAGWEGNDFLVEDTNEGYRITMVNTCEYAQWVNDGHQSFNQFGGPYEVHNRVKLPNPYPQQANASSYYVFGHFFVERGILQLTESKAIEHIMRNYLDEWWEDICNG